MKKKEKKYQLGGYVNLATGLGQAALGIGQFRRGGRDLAQVDSLEAGMIRSEAARKRMAQQQTDAMRGMQSITRNMATGVEALGRRGTRALVGGVQGLQAAADRATQSYLDKYGSASAARDRQLERADFGETARRVERDRQRAQMLRDAGYQNIFRGASQAIGGGLDLIPTKKTEDVKSLDEIREEKNALKLAADEKKLTQDTKREFDALDKLKENLAQDVEISSIPRPKVPSSVEDAEILDAIALEDTEAYLADPSLRSLMGFKKGGKAKKTPGKFSHKENPIDIMQKGSKIGEMTGGEYIFNPDQAKQLKSLSKKGNTPLHKFVNKMLNKSQFK
jgi:hypothetical protein|tara:strand:+ start:440 stop:1447 length:1008 start_codon:yes stop_codon:yes gene_type:complete